MRSRAAAAGSSGASLPRRTWLKLRREVAKSSVLADAWSGLGGIAHRRVTAEKTA
jgi:hypothetical protein